MIVISQYEGYHQNIITVEGSHYQVIEANGANIWNIFMLVSASFDLINIIIN